MKKKKKSKYHPKCLTCKGSCKQFAYVKIVRCPLYRKIDDKKE